MWHLEDWEHPRYFSAVEGVYLITINPDKPSDPTVQGAAQTQENFPDEDAFQMRTCLQQIRTL